LTKHLYEDVYLPQPVTVDKGSRMVHL